MSSFFSKLMIKVVVFDVKSVRLSAKVPDYSPNMPLFGPGIDLHAPKLGNLHRPLIRPLLCKTGVLKVVISDLFL